MKRQRFLAKQQAGGDAPGRRPGPLTDLGLDQRSGGGSPLSRLVAGGGCSEAQQVSSFNPYGERPSHASGGSLASGAAAGGGCTPGRGAGFDANVAGQWSSNVVREVERRQNRHDPNNAGPFVPAGGQRVTQAPGGASAVDLSWGGSHAPGGSGGSGVSNGAPPRMPRSGGGAGTPQGNYAGPLGCPALPYSGGAGLGAQQPYARGHSPSPKTGHGRGGSVGSSARSRAPFGCDDEVPAGRPLRRQQTPTRREATPPFGVDSQLPAAGAGVRSSSCGPPTRASSPHLQHQQQQHYHHQQRHQQQQFAMTPSPGAAARGSSPHHQYQQEHYHQRQQPPQRQQQPLGYGSAIDAPAAGFSRRGHVAGRTPGGSSQVVLG